jgi:hypothetical protein
MATTITVVTSPTTATLIDAGGRYPGEHSMSAPNRQNYSKRIESEIPSKSRSIVIHMRRRAPDEHITPFRRRVDRPVGNALRDRLCNWAAAVVDDIKRRLEIENRLGLPDIKI